MSKICVKCGRVMNDRANFCMSCGSSEFRAANGGRRVSPARPAIRKDDLRPAEAVGEIRADEAPREAGDSSLALGMTEAASEAAVEEPVDANSITFVYAEKHVEEPVEQDVPEPKKSRKGLWIAIAAVVLALGLAAVVLFVWPGFLSGK